MVHLHFPSEPEIRRRLVPSTPAIDGAIVVAANIVAAWLFEIAGPLFWAALIVIFVLAEFSGT
jgi:hypothetical protein